MDELRSYYERNLPHWLPPGHTVFITYRLAGTLPWHVLQMLEEEELLSLTPASASSPDAVRRRKRNFVRYDTWLDQDLTQPQWLTQPNIAALIRESFLHFDQREYVLHAYCIMPNHVHLLLTITEELSQPFYRVLQNQKRYSATHANRLLGRSGAFWQRESYDHLVRNEKEFTAILHYILQNPVKAGLVDEWQKWPYTYWAP